MASPGYTNTWLSYAKFGKLTNNKTAQLFQGKSKKSFGFKVKNICIFFAFPYKLLKNNLECNALDMHFKINMPIMCFNIYKPS